MPGIEIRPIRELRPILNQLEQAYFLSYFLFTIRREHQFHVFPRLAVVACFPTLGTGCMFSRSRHRLHVSPRLAPVACFSSSSDWFVALFTFVVIG